ncbi:hypothetical protein PW5551_02630 [Petrotoga sp. 9PW.55.5.1]|nr:hypothetical protein PW5551_02630 [Petrotoga sp. 9PW.55.5.1]
MDIFESFGIYLPMDTKYQENYIPAPKISFTHNIKERRKSLNSLTTGDLLFMKDHVMMFLGKVENEFFVIHQGAGYKRKKAPLKNLIFTVLL